MDFVLSYPPSANRYWRKWRNRIVKSDEARGYQAYAGWTAKSAGATLHAGQVALHLRIYRPRRCRDLDNCLKVLVDALQGVSYTNDNQVREIHAYLGDDKLSPRVEVEVQPLDSVGTQ